MKVLGIGVFVVVGLGLMIASIWTAGLDLSTELGTTGFIVLGVTGLGTLAYNDLKDKS